MGHDGDTAGDGVPVAVRGGRARRAWRVIWKVLLGVLGVGGALLFVTPAGRYLVHGATGEAQILLRRRSIDVLVADPTTDPTTRAKLNLVLDARRFAVDSVRLMAKKSFTTFSDIDRDTLVLVLTVAYRDSLAIKTWWWPIVGRVPYKGFFDRASAERAQRSYEADGYDTELRTADAFSTLGWFNDPLLSTTLRADSASLVETVIHELLHNTVWVNGDVTFNESLASFVGLHGAIDFFRSRGDTLNANRVVYARRFGQTMSRVYSSLYHSLDSAFRANPGPGQRAHRIAVRDSLFDGARARLATEVAPSLGIRDTTWARRVRLSIATLLARRVYREDVDAFDRILADAGGNLHAAVERIAEIARKAAPGKALSAVESSVR
jgi:predicted aminopeptidase